MNEAQIAAITTRVPAVLISAGAGSGKTMVLTQRYFRLLVDDGLKVDEILTLTFTRKAAQEMRERIAALLEAEGRVKERRDLHRAPIGTIHGFCERVLREHALQAGIDPNFRMLDDAEAHTLQENALDVIFEDLWSSATTREREALGRLLLDYPQAELRKSLLGLFRDARTRGLAIDDIAVCPLPDLALVGRELATAVEALLALPGTSGWQAQLAIARAALQELSPLLASSSFCWETYDQACELRDDLLPNGGPKDTAKAARDGIKEAFATWLGAYIDGAMQPYARAALTLVGRLAVAYQQAKTEKGLLDFEDLLLLTRDLLTGVHGVGAAEYYRQKFRQVMVDEFQDTNPLQFGIIDALAAGGHLFMVGDVKQSIYQFIGSDIRVFLAQEHRILAQGTAGVRLAMATNYRTRPELLEPLNGLFSRLWPLAEEAGRFTFEPLEAGQTFASKTAPSIEWAFWSGEGSADDQRDQEAAWLARRILQLTGALGEALPVTEKSTTPDTPPRTRPAAFRDIIILLRSFRDMPRYAEALRQAGVPLYVVGGRGFFQAREVQDLLHMLRVLENPLDDFSLAAVLRSPLVGVGDDALYWLTRDWNNWVAGEPYPAGLAQEGQYGRFWTNLLRTEEIPPLGEEDRRSLVRFRALVRELQAELPAGQPLDLIDLLLARTGYAQCLLAAEGGEQRFANVQKLREVAAEFQGRSIFDLSDFQRYLTQLSAVAPREAAAPVDVEESNVVRLMTIHAAKGLEAPVVVLADCGRSAAGMHELLLLTPAGITGKVPTPEDEWEQPLSYRRAVSERMAAEEAEAERLLYVALTRAREHLICSGFLPTKKHRAGQTYAALLTGLLGMTLPVEEDKEIPLPFEGTSYPVRIWSPASLQAVIALAPPPHPPTLWEEYRAEILAGANLPVLVDAAEVERFTWVAARLQPFPSTRREGPLRVGVGRAITYDLCPRQYWFQYVLGREGMPPGSAQERSAHAVDAEERADGIEFGLLLHHVMQRVDFALPLLAQLPALLETLPAPISEETADHLRRCLARFSALPLCAALQTAEPLYRELRFLIREETCYVPGIIDVLAKVGEEWWVVDYKTGNPAPGKHRRQVAAYALGVLHTLGVAPARLCVVYLDTEDEADLLEEPVTPALLNEARRIIRAAGEGLRDEEYAPRPGRGCTYCVHRGVCPQGAAYMTLQPA